MSDPTMKGYRKRMHNIWHESNNAPQTEQRLVDQIRGIMKNNWLSVIKREEIERPNFQAEDSHSNTPPEARSYEAEGNIEYLDKIKEWM